MIRSIKRAAAAAVLLCFAAVAIAATPNDFYLALLQRGVGHVKEGNFAQAAKELRIAAFGFVDSIPQFEIAQVYLTIATEKLGNEADARHAALRLIAAERTEAHYATLDVPVDVRKAFEQIASRILTSDQVAILHAQSTAIAPPPAPRPNSQPAAPIIAQPVAPIVAPTPTPKSPAPKSPASKSPAPITAQPISPIELPTPAPRSEVSAPTVPPPAPRQVQPQPKTPPRIVVPMPAPVPPPRVTITPVPAPAQTPAPQPRVVRAPTAPLTQTEILTRLTNAENALAHNDLATARVIYRSVVEEPIDHATALRVAEGSYRARDFSAAIRAFERAGAFKGGEEPYRYYLAVALYENGRYAAAKRELAVALPFIEITPDVARYRVKIEGAIE